MAKTNLTEIKGETANIKTATDKIANIETNASKIAGIDTKISAMEIKIKELETLVGKPNDTDHAKDTGIYKVIHDNFTELMGS